MGLFDEIMGRVGGADQEAQGQQKTLVQSLIQMLTSPETGGLQGLIQSFNQKGLGDIISSWVGKDQNAPINPDQVQEGLGDDKTEQLAEKSGLSVEEVKNRLAEILPGLIDRLTPEGKVDQDDLFNKGKQLLQGLFSKK